MDAAFTEERITKLKALIVAYEDALLALAAPGIESYTLDTGQTRQTVTKLDIDKLNKTYNSLMNTLCVLQKRLGQGGTSIGIPALVTC